MFSNEWFRQIGSGLQLSLVILWSTIGYAPELFAQGSKHTYDDAPDWWKARGVIEESLDEHNSGMANGGQLKWISTQAQSELVALIGDLVTVETELDLSSKIGAILEPPASGYDDWLLDNSTPLNLGQIKFVAKPYYDLLNDISSSWVADQLADFSVDATVATAAHASAHGYTEGGSYPWNPDTPIADNDSPANIGQLKAVFALALRSDVDQAGQGDQLPDLFEHALLHYNPGGEFSSVSSIDDVTWFPGDLEVSIDNGDGTFTKTAVKVPFPNLASANASLASLLDEHEVVGAVTGSFEVAGDGSGVYTLPIDIPVGTAGMAPKLAIAYSSSGGNGSLGTGFELTGLQRITRGPATYYKDGFVDGIDFDEHDRFFLDGERLIAVSGPYGADGTEYRTENNSFARIISHGQFSAGPAYWTVQTKSGLKLCLGSSSGSCVNAPLVGGQSPGVLVWSVCRVEDTVGNYYSVDYEQETAPGGSPYAEAIDYRPVEIRYTGNDAESLAPYNLIRFVYETRPDTSCGFLAGVKVGNFKRMASIEARYDESGAGDGSLIHKYEFSYDQSPQTSYSRLLTIKKVAHDGTEIPETTFTWHTPSSAPEPKAVLTGATSGDAYVTTYSGSNEDRILLDMNGDALPDRVYYEYVAGAYCLRVRINTGSGFGPASTWFTAQQQQQAFPKWTTGGVTYNDFRDMNGDGLPDRVHHFDYVNSDAGIWVALNNGSGFDAATEWLDVPVSESYVQSTPGGVNVTYDFIDLDGDGLLDRVYYDIVDNEHSLVVRRNTGAGFGAAEVWLQRDQQQQNYITWGAGGTQYNGFYDMNGDGLPDRVEHYNYSETTSQHGIWVSLNNGNGFDDPEEWLNLGTGETYPRTNETTGGDYSPSVKYTLFDINGDQLPDRVHRENQTMVVRLNTGNGFDDPAVWLTRGTAGQISRYQNCPTFSDDNGNVYSDFRDMNGDGLPDRVDHHEYGGSDWGIWVALNNGSGFDSPTEWLDRPQYDTNVSKKAGGHVQQDFVDFNGDGLLDRLEYRNDNGHELWVVYNTGEELDDTGSTTPDVIGRDVITSFTDGLGAVIKVEYQRMNEPTTAGQTAAWGGPANWKMAIYTKGTEYLTESDAGIISIEDGRLLVSRYAEQDGLGGFRWRRHHYWNLKYDRENETSLGFARMDTVDEAREQWNVTLYSQVDGDPATGPVTSTYPLNGLALESFSYCWDPVVQNQCQISYSQNYYETWSAADYNYGDGVTQTQYVQHPYQTKAISYRYDASANPLSITVSDQTFPDDQYGFLTDSVTVTAPWSGAPEDYATGASRTAAGTFTAAAADAKKIVTDNTYTHTINATDWHLGRLSDSTVYKYLKHADGSQAPVSTKNSTFSYYATHGLLETETVEPGHNQEVSTTRFYDDFGNVERTETTAATDAAGGNDQTRIAYTSYDACGRFILTESNDLGHTVTHEYNKERSLLVKTTDANGLSSAFFYDSFGTRILTRHPNGTETAEITRWADGGDMPTGITGAAPFDTTPELTFVRKSQSSGSPPAAVYLDSQGREVLTEATILSSYDGSSSTHTKVYSRTSYDQRGRKVAETQPFFSGDSIYATTISYDHLDRTKSTHYADNTSDSATYDGLVTTLKNRKGFHRIRTENVLGQEVENCDCGSSTTPTGSTPSVTYKYDTEGRVVQTNAPGGHVVTTTYDLLGNKIEITDSDAGTSYSKYNGFGELVETGYGSLASGTKTATFAYDILGRQTSRTTWESGGGTESVTNTTYDPLNAHGAVHTVTHLDNGITENQYTETHYDRLSRPYRVDSRVFGEEFTGHTSFDDLGRTLTETDAGGLTIKHIYDDEGFEVALKNYHTGTTYWEARDTDANGRALTEYLGNGVVTTRGYDQATGVLESIQSGVGGGSTLQNLTYGWDSLGNLRYRADALGTARYEHFKYDEHNRLLNYEVSTGTNPYSGHANLDSEPSISVNQHGYDIASNLTQKPGLSSISHTGHQLNQVTQNGLAHTYSYDSRGRLDTDTRNGSVHRSVSWTSFSQVSLINMPNAPRVLDTDGNEVFQSGSSTTSFEFGSSLERLRSTKTYNATNGDVESTVTTYLGSVERVVKVETPAVGSATSTTTIKHYLGGFAIVEKESVNGGAQSESLKYLLKDHLGSTEKVLSASAAVLEKLSFNAWGQQRDADTWGADPDFNQVTRASTITRGFTGHEMLDEAGLIHMNGRIYDAALGCFLSADPYVQAPENPHNYNRYSYVLNNPLSGTDPSGHVFSLFTIAFEIIRAAVGALIKIGTYAIKALGHALIPGANGGWGALAGAKPFAAWGKFALTTYQTVNQIANGASLGDILRGFAVNIITGGINAGPLHAYGNTVTDLLKQGATIGQVVPALAKHVIGHGIVGGIRNVAMGGKFKDGFISAAASTFMMDLGLSEAIGLGEAGSSQDLKMLGRTLVAGVIGGVVSEVGGGKFMNGFLTSAFQHLTNDESKTKPKKRKVAWLVSKKFLGERPANFGSTLKHWFNEFPNDMPEGSEFLGIIQFENTADAMAKYDDLGLTGAILFGHGSAIKVDNSPIYRFHYFTNAPPETIEFRGDRNIRIVSCFCGILPPGHSIGKTVTSGGKTYRTTGFWALPWGQASTQYYSMRMLGYTNDQAKSRSKPIAENLPFLK